MSENTVPSSSISYSPQSQPTSSDEEIKNASPRISIITGIALIAIALTVCGVLGVITKFSTQVTGLGAFSRLPLWLSSGMAFSGGAGVIALMTWAICQCKENQNQKILNDEESDPSSSSANALVRSSDNPSLPKEPEKLLLLSIKDIKNYNESCKKRLQDQLSSLQETTSASAPETEVHFSTLTLGQLRQLDQTDLLCYLATYFEDRPFILNLVTSTQFEAVLKSGILHRAAAIADLSKLLSSLPKTKCTMLLRSMTIADFLVYINVSTLSVDQLHMLSDRQLQDEHFPWEQIDQKKIKEFFSLNDASYDKSKRILQLLGSDAMAIVAPALSGEQLRLLSDQQFQDPKFPWELIAKDQKKIEALFRTDGPFFFSNPISERSEHILQLLGSNVIAILAPKLSGFQLRMLSDQQFKDSEFPWGRIAENPQTVTDLFHTDSTAHPKSQHILQLLGRLAINHLGHVLSENQLAMLSDEQRNPSFW